MWVRQPPPSGAIWPRTVASKVPAGGKEEAHWPAHPGRDPCHLCLQFVVQTFDSLQGSLGNVESVWNIVEQGSALERVFVCVCVCEGCLWTADACPCMYVLVPFLFLKCPRPAPLHLSISLRDLWGTGLPQCLQKIGALSFQFTTTHSTSEECPL